LESARRCPARDGTPGTPKAWQAPVRPGQQQALLLCGQQAPVQGGQGRGRYIEGSRSRYAQGSRPGYAPKAAGPGTPKAAGPGTPKAGSSGAQRVGPSTPRAASLPHAPACASPRPAWDSSTSVGKSRGHARRGTPLPCWEGAPAVRPSSPLVGGHSRTRAPPSSGHHQGGPATPRAQSDTQYNKKGTPQCKGTAECNKGCGPQCRAQGWVPCMSPGAHRGAPGRTHRQGWILHCSGAWGRGRLGGVGSLGPSKGGC